MLRMKKEINIAPAFHTWVTSSNDSGEKQTEIQEYEKVSVEVIRYGDTCKTD